MLGHNMHLPIFFLIWRKGKRLHGTIQMNLHLIVKHMDQTTKCFTDSQIAHVQETSKDVLKSHSQTGYAGFSLKAIVCSANSENIPVDS